MKSSVMVSNLFLDFYILTPPPPPTLQQAFPLVRKPPGKKKKKEICHGLISLANSLKISCLP